MSEPSTEELAKRLGEVSRIEHHRYYDVSRSDGDIDLSQLAHDAAARLQTLQSRSNDLHMQRDAALARAEALADMLDRACVFIEQNGYPDAAEWYRAALDGEKPIAEWRDKHSVACNTLDAVKAERDALRARVEELERERDEARQSDTIARNTLMVERSQLADAREALAILGMRVLQSELVLDEEEHRARDLGVEIARAALDKK